MGQNNLINRIFEARNFAPDEIPLNLKAISGKPEAIKKGVEILSGELLAFLDHDDLVVPERLEKQIGFLMEHPEVDAVSCHSSYIDESNTVLGYERYTNLSSVGDAKSRMREKKVVMCAFTGLTIRKRAFVGTGELRSEFWPCDDLDFINRFFEKGFLAVILPEALVQYRIHKASITATKQWHLFEMTEYTCRCLLLRRSNGPEIFFEAFNKLRNKDAFWKKSKQIRHNYSILFLQKAHFELNAKKTIRFLWCGIAATILDPAYVWANVKKRINGNTITYQNGSKAKV